MALSPVLSTDTPNAGRVKWNDNDTYLETKAAGDLTTHKSSSDHDGRYYTETEVNAIESGLEADINSVSDQLTTHKSSNDHDSRYYTEAEVNALIDAVELLILPELHLIHFAIDSIVDGTFGKSDGVTLTATAGVSPGKAGSILQVRTVDGAGTLTKVDFTAGVKTYADSDKFAVKIVDVAGDKSVYLLKNGTNILTGGDAPVVASAPVFVSVYLKVDN